MKLISELSQREGIVPVINLKSDHILNDGRVARELKIGETIKFGRFLNESIEWQVINKSDNGCPMLLSVYAIDYKPFDAKGDESRMYSDYIRYNEYDVNLLDDIQYKSTLETNDIKPPECVVLNENELSIRHNNSFVLNIKFIDELSGIDYIILPNGNKIKDTNISYTITKNSEYIFGSMDKSGNYNECVIPVSNINQEPTLDISTSTSEWTNNDVSIDLKSSNTVKYISTKIISNGDEYGGTSFPNYISYSNQEFKISGTANLISYNPSVLDKNANVKLGISYDYRGNNNGYSYTINTTWTTLKQISVNEIIEKKSVPFEFFITIPSNYCKNLKPWGGFTIPGYDGELIRVELKDLTYEIKDDSDFAINSIELPNGQIIENVKEYSDTITEDGIHNLTYKVIDNRGKITQKTIIVKIDKTAPNLNLNYSTNITNQNISVNISASDTTSGVKRVKLPNGNYITNLNSTYTISGDGEYTFECEDVAGNITTKTITINNIDKEKPNVSINKDNIEWTNGGVQININTRD